MTDTRRSYDADDLLAALDNYIETRFIGAAMRLGTKKADAARERLKAAIVRATGNPLPANQPAAVALASGRDSKREVCRRSERMNRLGGPVVGRRMRELLERENATWPEALKEMPRDTWPATIEGRGTPPLRAWRSRDFIVQLYGDSTGVERLTINSTHIQGNDWQDGFGWDVLQRLKAEAGFGDRTAIEIYPPDADIVNDGNLRHLWLLPGRLPFQWDHRNRAS